MDRMADMYVETWAGKELQIDRLGLPKYLLRASGVAAACPRSECQKGHCT